MTTIVGVMPEKFGFPAQMDAWLPLRIDPLAFKRGGGPAVEGTQLQAVARLKPGVSVEAAQAEMASIAPPGSPPPTRRPIRGSASRCCR